MNPTSNKSDFEDLTTNLKDLAYSYLEKYSPSKQQLKVFLLNISLINILLIAVLMDYIFLDTQKLNLSDL